ncbi:MAG: rRNA pseudouridine synthase [Lentisphaeraceae bacterium]|nr:rRNA pseudouridine synthase [Lentisphaeraceae bacterium]
MRLDKFTASSSELSRSEATKVIRGGRVAVNGQIEKNVKTKVDPKNDEITFNKEVLKYREFVYLMMHKPQNYICSTKDAKQATVLELLPELFASRKPHSCGRLDIDTTGLVLLTDDGSWSYGITSPKKKCMKTYLVHSLSELGENDIKQLEEGIMLEDEDKPTLPAEIKRLGKCYYELKICEGRFHQIKRMFIALYNKVEKLHRQSIGPVTLGDDLKEGDFRELTDEEIEALRP